MGLFGRKNKEPKPEPPQEPFTVGKYQVFPEGVNEDSDPVMYAARLAKGWTIPYAKEEGVVNAARLQEEVEMACVGDVSAFIVDNETGSLGMTQTAPECIDEQVLDPDYEYCDVVWIGVAEQSAKAVCPGCGAAVKPGDAFCENCGRKL